MNINTDDKNSPIPQLKPSSITVSFNILINIHVDHILATNFLPCNEISDHDAPYVIVYIRREKATDIRAFKKDIERLPLNLGYIVDCPKEKLDIFATIFLCPVLNKHAPLIKAKITQSPAAWLKHLNINNLQIQRNILRERAYDNQLDHG